MRESARALKAITSLKRLQSDDWRSKNAQSTGHGMNEISQKMTLSWIFACLPQTWRRPFMQGSSRLLRLSPCYGGRKQATTVSCDGGLAAKYAVACPGRYTLSTSTKCDPSESNSCPKCVRKQLGPSAVLQLWTSWFRPGYHVARTFPMEDNPALNHSFSKLSWRASTYASCALLSSSGPFPGPYRQNNTRY